MSLWNGRTINEALGVNLQAEIIAEDVVIDSRKVKKNSIFVAIKGEKFDANDFALQAIENGASLVIADSKKLVGSHPNILVVEDSLQALVKLARYKRKISQAVFIGITGSVGKTTVKEATGMLLSKQGKTHITSGNLNNHIGLPLTLANLPDDAKYAVIELGMNHAGEISYLTDICKPNVALVTFVAAVHIEFFDSVKAIAFAKAEIFEGLTAGVNTKKIAILPAENEYFDILKQQAVKHSDTIISFGKNTNHWRIDGEIVYAEIEGNKISFKPFQYSNVFINNMLAALTAVYAAGADIQQASKDVSSFSPPKGRGRIIQTKYGTIIDDAYNASPESMRASLRYLSEFKDLKKVALVGDMRELGENSPAYHESLADAFGGIDKVYLYGKDMHYLYNKIKDSVNAEYISDFDDILPTLKNFLKDNNTITLIKSSNGTGLWKIVEKLEQSE